MSEFMDALRKRVEQRVAPHRDLYGKDAPVVRMAFQILADAEEVEQELAGRWVSTQDAHDRTGWHPETLQARAKTKLAGESLPAGWEKLEARWNEATRGYEFVIGTVPAKRGVAA